MLEISISGLPNRSRWPEYVAIGLMAIILLATTKKLFEPAPVEGAVGFGALSARARKDRIVKAIEILDAELAKKSITEAKYQRRHNELIALLGEVLREIELEEAERAGSKRA